MKAIVVAAGEGKRLRPLTASRPKCMVEYRGKPLLDRAMDALHALSITDVTVVRGYLGDRIRRTDVRFRENPLYDRSNMVYSLFCAEQDLDGDDVIVSYGDILYTDEVLRRLVESEHDFSVVVDEDWRTLWEQRMSDPLADAETLKLDPSGRIIELGLEPRSYEDIEAQYIGLFKISAAILEKVKSFYAGLDRDAVYRGKSFMDMEMTTFIQLVIDRLLPVHAVRIRGGWLEIDAASDLEITWHRE